MAKPIEFSKFYRLLNSIEEGESSSEQELKDLLKEYEDTESCGVFLKYVAIAELTSSKERKNEFTLRVNKLCDKYLKTSGIKKILSHSDLNRTNSVFSLGSTKSTKKSDSIFF